MERFNAPPGWEVKPHPWFPPPGFKKEEGWPEAPEGWEFWVEYEEEEIIGNEPEKAVLEIDVSTIRDQVEKEIRSRLVELDDKLVLQEAGIYEYHHPLENADSYKEALDEIRGNIRACIKNRKAISSGSKFIFENSVAKGAKLFSEISSLALNGFNQEVENSIRTLKSGTLEKAKQRIYLSAEKISKFGKSMELSISPDFLNLRIKELELVADFLAKVEEQKQLQRDERERLREEAKARQELEAKRQKLLKERSHLENALAGMVDSGSKTDLAFLELRLIEVQEAIERNDYRLTNIRAGYVYVISNEGAFGAGVLKIGMTRRLEPMDRVNELGDASVPFRFSVHALFFSEDAVGLESALHEAFASKRLNQVNQRKEFFFASPNEVKQVLLSKVGAMLEFYEEAISEEYLQSKHYWPTR